MIKFSKRGIHFSYHDDVLIRSWPWSKETDTYWSSLVGRGFRNLRDYWIYLGAIHTTLRTHKLKGFSGLDLAREKARLESRYGPVLLIYNLDPVSKPVSFWAKLGKAKSQELNSEFCLLFPDSVHEAQGIQANLPPEFAELELYDGGQLVTDVLK